MVFGGNGAVGSVAGGSRECASGKGAGWDYSLVSAQREAQSARLAIMFMITKEMKELSMTQLKPQSFENEVVSVFTVRRSEKERGGVRRAKPECY